jgi:Tol biopolymer transport system component
VTGIAGLDPGAFLDDQPAKSPDGQKIAFARRSTASGPSQLWVIDADGRNPVLLTTGTNTGDNTAPAWSPDGKKIAFQCTRSGSKNIDVWAAAWNASSSTLSSYVNLTNASGDDVSPGWSPTNVGKLAFASNRNQSQFEIFFMTVTGASVTRMTNDPHTDREPSWSPDGTKVTFSSDRAGGSGAFEIYTMGPTGNSQQRLTSLSGDDRAPYVLADGSIAYASTSLQGLAILRSPFVSSTKVAGTVAGDANPG